MYPYVYSKFLNIHTFMSDKYTQCETLIEIAK